MPIHSEECCYQPYITLKTYVGSEHIESHYGSIGMSPVDIHLCIVNSIWALVLRQYTQMEGHNQCDIVVGYYDGKVPSLLGVARI